jgi:hypothetical protein
VSIPTVTEQPVQYKTVDPTEVPVEPLIDDKDTLPTSELD